MDAGTLALVVSAYPSLLRLRHRRPPKDASVPRKGAEGVRPGGRLKEGAPTLRKGAAGAFDGRGPLELAAPLRTARRRAA